MLLLGAFAGALVDRSDRRRLLIVTQSLSIVLGVLLAVLAGTGAIEVWMLFAAALAGGCILAVDGPARQVYVLELVGSERTASAVGLYEIVINVSRVLGPATGGVLLATVGASACFAVNAASFVPPLLVLLLAHRRGRVEAHVPRAGSVRAGLAYVRRAPAIRACILLAAAERLLFNFGVALPLLVTRTFHGGGGIYGALVAVFGVGAIGGALFAAGGPPAPSGRRVRAAGRRDGRDGRGDRRRAGARAGVRRARRGGLSLDLVHRPGQHPRPDPRRAGPARPGHGRVVDGPPRDEPDHRRRRGRGRPDGRAARRVRAVGGGDPGLRRCWPGRRWRTPDRPELARRQ